MEFDAGRFYNVRHAIVYIHTHVFIYVRTYLPWPWSHLSARFEVRRLWRQMIRISKCDSKFFLKITINNYQFVQLTYHDDDYKW